MKIKVNFKILLLLLSLLNITIFAQMFGQEPTERQRTYDVQHINIDIFVDLEMKLVSGKVKTSIVPLSNDFTDFEVDAIGMSIKNVQLDPKNPKEKKYSGKKVTLIENIIDLKFDYNRQKIKIYLDKPYSVNDTLHYIISYTTTDPEKGLYFISPTPTFPNKRYEVWSQGEGEDNRYWFPCYDYPNDMATTEMYITVDSKYQTLSNGILESKKEGNGVNVWHWVNELPHVSYLVMLGVGNWDVIEEGWEGIPISSYVTPGKKEWGERSYRNTKDILKFFSEYIGFKYPWGKFSQVAVQDFIYGGMENTGAVVLFDGSIYDDKTEPDYNATNLVAHELAHQWWGDVVTCKNWNEIWLNESFATYFQCLYTEHLLGKDEFDYNIFRNGNDAIKVDSTTARKPIYTREGLTTNTYDKGSAVLNMLRYLVGDEKFQKTMNLYITKHRHTPVVTKNLVDALHEAINNQVIRGLPADLTWFFEEWIYKAGQPELKVSYDYDENTKELSLTAQQVQRMDSSSVFKTPFPFQIITASGKQDFSMETSTEPRTYKIKLDSKPLSVIFNKGNKVLSKLYFTKPKEDWLYQLKNSQDAIERITALKGLKDFINDDDVINEITVIMKTDKFWGVRYEAAQILSNSTNKLAQEVYIKNLVEEPDSRVRRSYITGLGLFYEKNPELKENKSVLEFFLINLINNETSYYAIADGISTLAKIMDKGKLYDIAAPFTNKESHVEIIRRHVMAALEVSKDPRALDILLKYAEEGSTARLRNTAISGLGNYLDNPKVIDFLNKKVLEKTRSTQGVILGLLEKAKSPSSKPYFEELLAKSNDDGFKKKVTETLQKIN
jgi:aminopeptidase N